jgi:hypothetical protein
MKKVNEELTLVPFKNALAWIKSQNPHECSPVYISKAKPTSLKFRVWCFADALLLASNENDAVQRQYILNEEKWNVFCEYVRNHPQMGRGELGKKYREFGCTDPTFWPSIIHICEAYLTYNMPKLCTQKSRN